MEFIDSLHYIVYILYIDFKLKTMTGRVWLCELWIVE